MSRYRMIAAFLAGLLGLTAGLAAHADETTDLDEKLLKEHKVGTDGPGLLAFLRQRVLADADRNQVEQLVRQLGSDQFSEREKATEALSRRGPAALPFLRRAMRDPDLEVRRRAERCIAAIEQGPGPALPAAVIRLLAVRRPAGAVQALLQYLPFADEESVEEEAQKALAALGLRDGKADEALVKALKDADRSRRRAAAFVVGRSTDKQQREAVRALLKDSDPSVRFRAAQGLIAGRDKEAVPALLSLLTDGPPDLAWRAEELLQRIASDRVPEVSSGDGSQEARKKWRGGWAKWWADHGAKVDLARVEEKPPFLNLTLVPEMHANKVWECGPDGKVRWTIDGLNCPRDAQVLPGGRLLVSEVNSNRVIEMDMRTRKVLWEFKTRDPHCVKRLPNGHTFLLALSGRRVCLIDRAGKEVFGYQPEQAFFIHSTTPLTNGNIALLSMAGELREVDRKGKVVRSLNLAGGKPGNWCHVDELPGGRFLVVELNQGQVLEIDGKGKVLWQHQLQSACCARRLPNGNTLIASNGQRKLFEVTRAGKVVWQKDVTTNPWHVYRR